MPVSSVLASLLCVDLVLTLALCSSAPCDHTPTYDENDAVNGTKVVYTSNSTADIIYAKFNDVSISESDSRLEQYLSNGTISSYDDDISTNTFTIIFGQNATGNLTVSSGNDVCTLKLPEDLTSPSATPDMSTTQATMSATQSIPTSSPDLRPPNLDNEPEDEVGIVVPIVIVAVIVLSLVVVVITCIVIWRCSRGGNRRPTPGSGGGDGSNGSSDSQVHLGMERIQNSTSDGDSLPSSGPPPPTEDTSSGSLSNDETRSASGPPPPVRMKDIGLEYFTSEGTTSGSLSRDETRLASGPPLPFRMKYIGPEDSGLRRRPITKSERKSGVKQAVSETGGNDQEDMTDRHILNNVSIDSADSAHGLGSFSSYMEMLPGESKFLLGKNDQLDKSQWVTPPITSPSQSEIVEKYMAELDKGNDSDHDSDDQHNVVRADIQSYMDNKSTGSPGPSIPSTTPPPAIPKPRFNLVTLTAFMITMKVHGSKQMSCPQFVYSEGVTSTMHFQVLMLQFDGGTCTLYIHKATSLDNFDKTSPWTINALNRLGEATT